MTFKKQAFLYQFGDPIRYNINQDPHSFLFNKTGFRQIKNLSIKNREGKLEFTDGQYDPYGDNIALLDGENLTVNFGVPADYDFQYLDLIFVGKRKKIFLVEFSDNQYKIYVNFARYITGLNRNYGEDIEADEEQVIFSGVEFKINSPYMLDITKEVEILNHDVLTQGTYSWENTIPGADWEIDPTPNIPWESSLANYRLNFSDLTHEEQTKFLDKYCNNPKYYFTWNNTWVETTDYEAFPATNIQSINIINNTDVFTSNLSSLDLASSNLNTIWKIKINQSGGLSTNESVTIENPKTKSGFIFTWLGIANSSDNIMINTAQEYVWDLDNHRIIDSRNYKITLAQNEYSKILAVQSSLIPNKYPNPNLEKTNASIYLTKTSSTPITVTLSNLKTFYL